MKNKKLIICLSIFILLLGLVLGGFFYYHNSLKPVANNNEPIIFNVEPLTSKKEIAQNLKAANLIKSDTTLLIYLFFNKDINLQAGEYELSQNMSALDILNKIAKGDVKLNTVSMTFVEGKNMNDLISLISKTFSVEKSEVKSVLENEEFIQSLVEKYDFLTNEILNDNIYYALEGYLFPDTYTFLENASIEEVITKMLDNTNLKLSDLKVQLTNSNYTIHEIMTKASIIELEAKSLVDRQKVSQVIDKRLSNAWVGPLGMDVTTYYAVQKDMSAVLTINDLNVVNPYNTRDQSGLMNNKLPVGPICNPSLSSIEAALNPSATNYVWFVANVCTGEVFFQETNNEFITKSYELRQVCELN